MGTRSVQLCIAGSLDLLPLHDLQFAMLCTIILIFFLLRPRPPTTTLFPYTTLFRSQAQRPQDRRRRCDDPAAGKRVSPAALARRDRKSTRLNSSHVAISYAVLSLKKKNDDLPPDN